MCMCAVLNSFLILCVSQDKQDEAHYLREHRGELIEELAKTIVQKVKTKLNCVKADVLLCII